MQGRLAIDLPKHPVVQGHPIHAILSDGPAVLIPLALAMEAWRRTRKDNVTEPLSRLATLTATAAAAAAAVVGWIDWLTIPGDHPARTPATVHGLINTPGLIDAGYRGELKVLLVNTDPSEDFLVKRGERIAQLVIQRVENVNFREVDELPSSERGSGGFGSTG